MKEEVERKLTLHNKKYVYHGTLQRKTLKSKVRYDIL